jgi:hypothetical protein
VECASKKVVELVYQRFGLGSPGSALGETPPMLKLSAITEGSRDKNRFQMKGQGKMSYFGLRGKVVCAVAKRSRRRGSQAKRRVRVAGCGRRGNLVI